MRRVLTVLIGVCLVALSLNAAEKSEKKDELKKVKLSGFVNLLYQGTFEDGKSSSHLVRVRRAQIAITGDLNEYFSYKVQANPADIKSPVRDVWFKVKFNKAFQVQAGQIKLPFTYENTMHPLDMMPADYCVSVKKFAGDASDVSGLGYAGRDLGVNILGSFWQHKRYGHDIIKYNLGLYKGTGANNFNAKKSVDVIGRVEAYPLKELMLTGSFWLGGGLEDTDGKSMLKDRVSAGLFYRTDKLYVAGEYIHAFTGDINDNGNVFQSNGGYLGVGYWFSWKSANGKKQKFMPLLRYDFYQERIAAPSTLQNYLTAGITYQPFDFVNFKLHYSNIFSGDNSAGNFNTQNQLNLMVTFKF